MCILVLRVQFVYWCFEVKYVNVLVLFYFVFFRPIFLSSPFSSLFFLYSRNSALVSQSRPFSLLPTTVLALEGIFIAKTSALSSLVDSHWIAPTHTIVATERCQQSIPFWYLVLRINLKFDRPGIRTPASRVPRAQRGNVYLVRTILFFQVHCCVLVQYLKSDLSVSTYSPGFYPYHEYCV